MSEGVDVFYRPPRFGRTKHKQKTPIDIFLEVVPSLQLKSSISFGDVSRFFTGSPTDKAIWLMVGGIVAAVVGLFGILRGGKGD